MSNDRRDVTESTERSTERARQEMDDEYQDVDPDTVTEDAVEYFDDDGEVPSPASDADAPPPG